MEPLLGFGLTAVFMGSTRWKLNWHFYAHFLGQMLGRTRCCSCFLPASPTTEWNIKRAHWSHWKLLTLSPEGLEDVHNYWSTESYLADFFCDTAWLPAPMGISPEYEPSAATTEPIRSKMTHVICRWTKIIFQNQALEIVCLCLEASLCFFPPQACVTTLGKKGS